MSVPFWGWLIFAGIVAVALALDLFLHRHGRVDSARGAALWSVGWVVLSLLFNLGLWIVLGREPAEEFLSAYLLEKSLSVDNLFVFLLVFERLRIPAGDERHVLTWGILGAIVTRGLFIALGTVLLERWHAVIYVFGAILVLSAFRMIREPQASAREQGALLPWLQRHIPFTSQLHETHFVVKEGGRWLATPLLLALVTIELTDIVFAIDSIPAAFAVTERPFIVYTSNVFALFGLRSLYVVVARGVRDLKYLRFGLAAILLFAGAKMLTASWIRLPAWASLAVIATLVTVTILASLRARRRSGSIRGADA